MNNLQIQIPEGYQIDIELTKLENGEVKFKKIEKTLPTKWEDLGQVSGYFIASDSTIIGPISSLGSSDSHRNVWPTKELAKASLALGQLVRFRDAWNNGWVPDWKDANLKYLIRVVNGVITEDYLYNSQAVLHFKSIDVRDAFLENFKDLIEEAKPLL